jgi:Zn-finger nucleic acid-binding protein
MRDIPQYDGVKMDRKPQYLRCPRDEAILAEAPEYKCRAHACKQCQGVFVDVDKVVGLRAHAACHRNVRRPLGQAHLHCPHDQAKLVPFTFRGVEIDVCYTCYGVWLDGGELKKITACLPELPAQGKPRQDDAGLSIGDGIELAECVVDIADFIYSALRAFDDA